METEDDGKNKGCLGSGINGDVADIGIVTAVLSVGCKEFAISDSRCGCAKLAGGTIISSSSSRSKSRCPSNENPATRRLVS